MRSPWITITFLAFCGISIGAPVAEPYRKDAGVPFFGHAEPHANVHTSHGVTAVDVGSGHSGVHVHANAKNGHAGAETKLFHRSPQGDLGSILGPLTGSAGQQPSMNNGQQGVSSLLAGILPLGAPAGQEPGVNAPARRSPQGLGSILNGILGTGPSSQSNRPSSAPSVQPPKLPTTPIPQQAQSNVPAASAPTTPSPAAPSTTPSQANPVSPRSPQDLSKLLGIVFPPPPAPAPQDGDSSSSPDRREPQIDQVTSLLSGLFTPSQPGPAARRWLGSHAASEASSDVNTDSTTQPHHFDHGKDHGEHHPIKNGEHHPIKDGKHHPIKDAHHPAHDAIVLEAGVPGRSPNAAVHLGPGELHVAAHGS